jgi:hypothetical protein
VRDVLLFLAKFLVLSAVLFVAFTAAEEHYYTMLAHATAATAPLTGSSIEVVGVEGNVMNFIYGGIGIPARLIFAAFNPVILFSLLAATPRIGRRLLTVGLGGFVLLLMGQVITLRLFLPMQVRGYAGTPDFEFLEVITLISICVNWVLPIIIWIVWVPTGFLARALKAGFLRSAG